MPSRSDVQQLRAEYKAIRGLVERDLRELWSSLDLSRPEAARDVLLQVVPALVDSYGDAAAAVAAEWYDDMRAAEGVRGRFRAQPQESVYLAAAEGTVRRVAGDLFTENPDPALAALTAKAPKFALSAGRQTVIRSSELDPDSKGWKRVTGGAPCKFCRLLAGRGAVYTKGSVHFASHADCNCASAPEWDQSAPEVGVAEYEASRRTTNMTPAEKADHNARIQRAIDEYVD